MKYYAIIDTNVIISALIKETIDSNSKQQTNPRKILDFIKNGTIIPFINSRIIAEYIFVLTRNKFHFNKDIVFDVIDLFIEKSLFANCHDLEFGLPDKNDVVFYAVTISAREETDAYLVTGNIKDFPREPYVVSPKEMIDIIESKLK